MPSLRLPAPVPAQEEGAPALKCEYCAEVFQTKALKDIHMMNVHPEFADPRKFYEGLQKAYESRYQRH